MKKQKNIEEGLAQIFAKKNSLTEAELTTASWKVREVISVIVSYVVELQCMYVVMIGALLYDSLLCYPVLSVRCCAVLCCMCFAVLYVLSCAVMCCTVFFVAVLYCMCAVSCVEV